MSQKITTEQAWAAYRDSLITFIRFKVDTPEDAEDILSDVFTKLIKKADDNQMPDNITSWLHRVARNRIVDYYRTKKSFETLPEDLVSYNEEVNTINQLSNCLVPMIKTLPQNYQQPLILSEIEGKKYKELAQDLNLSLPAVKSRIIRGREKLYRSLLACCSIQRDNAGNIMDYEQKSTHSCSDCGN